MAPLVLVALCYGVGLLVERLVAVRLPGPAIPGVGLAGIIAVAGLLTIADATAELAAPVCVVLAVAGVVLGRRRLSLVPVALFAAVYVVFAWPSVMSGQESIAGYIKLDDSAIWIGLIAHLMEHGRNIADVPPSTFQLDLDQWLGQGYPVGTFTPIGVTARVAFQDLSNVYQPAICVYAGIFALGVYGVVRELVKSRWLAAGAAFIGVQASLFAGYVWWGSVKEICVAALLPVFVLAARGGHARTLLIVGLVAAAFMNSFGAGGVLWAGAGCGAAALLALSRPLLRFLTWSAASAAVVVAGSIPAIVVLGENALQTTKGSPVQEEDLGKLYAKLDPLQGAGLWPAGDFRLETDPESIIVVLAVIGLVLAVGGFAYALYRRQWQLPALIALTVAGAVPALIVAGPWVDAKVLAVTSAVFLSGAAALVAVGLERLPLLAAPGAVVLVGATLVSTWLAARDVYIAPRDTLIELRDLGEKVDGEGPLLMLNYEGYATRYQLYRADVEGASDLRVSLIPSKSGEPFPNFSTVEVDDVDTSALFAFRLLSRRLTPVGSRPPSAFEPFETGDYFETWQRRGEPPVEHLSLGGGLAPAADVTCARLRQLAAKGTTLVAAPLENPVVADLAAADLPVGWASATGVRPVTDGAAKVTVSVPSAGEWRVWVGGGMLASLEVSVDGKPVGSVLHQLDASIGWIRFDATELEAGDHVVTLRVSRSSWRPGRGSDDSQVPLGPLALTREGEEELETVPSDQVDRLCDGRTYDWVEVLA